MAINLRNLIRSTYSYKRIKDEFSRGIIHHSYIIEATSPDIIDRFVLEMSKLFFCKSTIKACDDCRDCDFIEMKNHPDIFYMPNSLLVADVEAIIDEASMHSFNGGYKIFVIPDISNCKLIVQNKLLKLLEEPPINTVLLLGMINSNNVLDTVKSRCLHISVNKFLKQDIEESIEGADDFICQVLSDFSMGDCSEILLIDKNKEIFEKNFLAICDILSNMKSSDQISDYFRRYSDILFVDANREISREKQREEFILFLWIFERIIHLLILNGKLLPYQDKINRIKSEYNLASLANIVDILLEIRKKTELNLDVKQSFYQLLYKILEVKYLCQK